MDLLTLSGGLVGVGERVHPKLAHLRASDRFARRQEAEHDDCRGGGEPGADSEADPPSPDRELDNGEANDKAEPVCP